MRTKINMSKGNIDFVLKDLNEIISIDHNEVNAYINIADILYNNKNDNINALKHYKLAHFLNKNDLHSINMINQIEREIEIGNNIKSIKGNWTGYYIAGQGKTSAKLRILSVNNNKIRAIFEFFPHPDNPYVRNGSYEMVGFVDSEFKISFTGVKWIQQPQGYVFYNFNAILDLQKDVIYNTSKENTLYFKKEETNILDMIKRCENNFLSQKTGRLDNAKGSMKNNNPNTIRGEGFDINFFASSGDMKIDDIISLCSIRPFTITYFPNKQYSIISGKIGYDNITKLEEEFLGLHSAFRGITEIYFLGDGKIIGTIKLTPQKLIEHFNISIKNIEVLQINFKFKYSNMFYDNYLKYFNIINAKLLK